MKGAFTALVTPMKDDGAVDYDLWLELIEFQIADGIDGLVPLGTTGETPTLDDGEEEALIKIIVKAAKGKVPLIVGAGSNSTDSMIHYTKRAAELGADAVLVATPYYNKPNDSGLVKHFEAAVKAGVPVVVYNIPGRTGRNIPASLMKVIMQIPNIVGVKEASGDIVQIADTIHIASTVKPAFEVSSGDDGLTLPVMALGGVGVVSVLANLVPKKVAALTAALSAGNLEEGRTLHYELADFAKAAFIETNPVPIKAAMNMAADRGYGVHAGPVRLPLGPLAEGNAASLQLVVKSLLKL
jgi:4-hydroxy-tetrahydrodipicolinate synthase